MADSQKVTSFIQLWYNIYLVTVRVTKTVRRSEQTSSDGGYDNDVTVVTLHHRLSQRSVQAAEQKMI